MRKKIENCWRRKRESWAFSGKYELEKKTECLYDSERLRDKGSEF